jgi:hypothetical protein
MTPESLRLESLLDAVVDLAAEARNLDVASYENEPLARITEQLLPSTVAVLVRGREVLDRLLAVCETGAPGARAPSPPDSSGQFQRQVDALMSDGRGDALDRQLVADLCFLACGELRRKLEELTRLQAAGDRWGLLAGAAGARRKLVKAAAAVDNTACRGLGRPPRLGFATETALSLAARQTVAKFRWRLLAQAIDDCESRLRHAGGCLAWLVGRDGYLHLRASDRRVTRELQSRVLAWLGPPQREPQAGVHLWQDILGFTALLLEVNRRLDVERHDSELVARALAGGWDSLATARASLRPLLGLDEELDACLLAPDERDDACLLPILRRLEGELTDAGAAAAGDEGEWRAASEASSHGPHRAKDHPYNREPSSQEIENER